MTPQEALTLRPGDWVVMGNEIFRVGQVLGYRGCVGGSSGRFMVFLLGRLANTSVQAAHLTLLYRREDAPADTHAHAMSDGEAQALYAMIAEREAERNRQEGQEGQEGRDSA